VQSTLCAGNADAGATVYLVVANSDVIRQSPLDADGGFTFVSPPLIGAQTLCGCTADVNENISGTLVGGGTTGFTLGSDGGLVPQPTGMDGMVLQTLTTADARRLPLSHPVRRALHADGDAESMTRPAVVLFSGGLDSSTCLAIAREEGFAPHALAVRYGQRHAHELRAAERVAAAAGVPLKVVRAGPARHRRLGPDGRSSRYRRTLLRGRESQVTYVPARNTVLLAARAGARGSARRTRPVHRRERDRLLRLPDCRPAFVRAFEALANVRHRGAAGVETFATCTLCRHAPLLQLSKAEIIRLGTRLGVPYGLTHSCYDPDLEGRACGRCDSCRLRRQASRKRACPIPRRTPEIEVSHAHSAARSRPRLPAFAQEHVHGSGSDKVPVNQKHALDPQAPRPKGQKVSLKADGGEAKAYVTKPRAKPRGAILPAPRVVGLNDWVKSMADRLAGEGYLALAVDLYKGKVTADAKEAGALMGQKDEKWGDAVEEAGSSGSRRTRAARRSPRWVGAVEAASR